LKAALAFLLQSIVVGLAAAFLVVLVRPDLLPVLRPQEPALPLSYADAVDISSPAVANVYTKRLVQDSDSVSARTRFRVSTNFASAVVIDAEGYLVTNYHVVAEAAEIRVQLSDQPVDLGRILRVERQGEYHRGISFAGGIEMRVPVARPECSELWAAATLPRSKIDDLVVAQLRMAVGARSGT
jgi:hypothetical protein